MNLNNATHSYIDMPTQNFITALRDNIARSISFHERETGATNQELSDEIKKYIKDNNIDEVKITKTDITRCKNTSGGKDKKGARISIVKLGVIEKFLKDTGKWKQFVQIPSSDHEKYYSNISELIIKKSNEFKIISDFDKRRTDYEIGSEPAITGYYWVLRRSMHSLGRINRSKIRFYTNAFDDNIYQFEELRKIKKVSGQEYTLKFTGFVNFIRNTYLLNGSCQLHSGIEGQQYTPFPEIMYIHNDRDIERLVGIWSSVTRENSHPCSSPVIMRKITEEEYNSIELGIIDEEVIDRYDLQTFDRSINNELGMIYIPGNFDAEQ